MPDTRAAAGFEYVAPVFIGTWPLLHVCLGVDPVTLRLRAAKGVIAIGNIALGVVAIGGIAAGFVSLGGVSLGLLLALGGAAIGGGVSLGGLAVGSVAMGGVAVGFTYAIGGVAFGPAVADGTHCDPRVIDFVRAWVGDRFVPQSCR